MGILTRQCFTAGSVDLLFQQVPSSFGWGRTGLKRPLYFPVSTFRLMKNWFLLSKELMDFVGLFLPLLSAQIS
jgi:hypothetical protein